MRLTLGWKFGLVVAAFLLLWFGHAGIASLNAKYTEVFAEHVDDAGKLRMYSQRIAFLVEECVELQAQPSTELVLCRSALELALKQYAANIASVRRASAALLLPQDQDAVQRALRKLEADAAAYRTAAAALLESTSDSAANKAYVLQHADLMLDRAEILVRALVKGQIRVQRFRDRLNNALQGIGLLLLVVVTYIGRRQVLQPVREITRLARRASHGDYKSRVRQKTNDEIGALAAAFNQSNARTQRLIDELAAGQAAAKRAEQEARSLLESAADGIVISDMAGHILRLNREAERIFGYSRQELVGSTVEQLIPERLRTRHRAYQGAYAENATSRVMGPASKVVGLRSDGSEVPLEISLSPVKLAEKPHVIAVVRDVTEREQAEADRRRLLTILDATPDLVAIFTPSRELSYLNPAGRQLLGIGLEDALSEHSIDELLSSSARNLLKAEALPIALATGHWSGELDLQDTQGQAVPVSQQLIAHLDEEGRPTHVSAIARDISERRQHEARLLYKATHDQLTGLANRALFRDRLEQAVYQAERSGKLVALVFIDLDDFKQINDSLGHAAGDALLREIAKRLQTHLRKSDTRARFGGDEFAVILENLAHLDDAVTVVESLVEELHRPMYWAGQEIVVTTSIGISLFPRDASSKEQLLLHADTAMYRAKAEGRSSYRVYNASMEEVLTG